MTGTGTAQPAVGADASGERLGEGREAETMQPAQLEEGQLPWMVRLGTKYVLPASWRGHTTRVGRCAVGSLRTTPNLGATLPLVKARSIKPLFAVELFDLPDILARDLVVLGDHSRFARIRRHLLLPRP